MSTVRVFVGIDYHDQELQVCVLDESGRVVMNCPCGNSAVAVAGMVSRQGGMVFAAIEACCGAAHLADQLTVQFGWSVDLAHPGYVRRMKQNPDKTDYSDARLLADLERVGYLPKVWQAPAAIRDLRDVVRYRQQLADQQRSIKLRVRALLRQHRQKPPESVNAWTKAWIGWVLKTAELPEACRWVIAQHLAELEHIGSRKTAAEARLEQMTASDPLVEYLTRFNGFGRLTAIVLRAELGRFDRFRTGKQMARFCGLSPRNASSGQKEADAGLIRASNPQLRTTMIELAHRMVRFQVRWAKMKRDLVARGKPGSVAVAAVAHRLVRWLFHQAQADPGADQPLAA
jgi:transposase